MMWANFAPWHVATAQGWLGQRERFAHAWLIHGAAGIGKVDFALAAAASLLCEAPQHGLACGVCTACGWIRSGNHPDLRRLRPDAVAQEEGATQTAQEDSESTSAASKKTPSRDIRIDQIRTLEPWFNTATHRGGWRVAVLYPAQALNVISANALLKVLEEPPAHTVFLIVADAPDRLLPTLVSRCRRLPLAMPEPALAQAWLTQLGVEQAEAWLAAAGGAPYAAQRLAASSDAPVPDWLASLAATLAEGSAPDVGGLADTLEKIPAVFWLDTLQRFFTDLVLAAHGGAVRYFPSLAVAITRIGIHAPIGGVIETARWLTQQRALATHPLNAKLFSHTALLRVTQACQA